MYTINEVAEIFNITTNKIRFYEKKKLILPRRNKDNEYRTFTNEDIIRLQAVLLYRDLGLSIEHIEEILNKDSKETLLDNIHKQWQVINDEIHRAADIRNTLENIMDRIYENASDDYMEEVLSLIKANNKQILMKNQWKDRWNFNSWADTYDISVKGVGGSIKIYENYDYILNTVHSLAKENIPKEAHILEIGVGTGNLANRFFYEGDKVIGVDQSREMLRVAKEKNPKLKVRIGEFLKLPFDNDMFDVIVSTYAFHHLKEEEKIIAIKEMMRVLKENGKIVIGDMMFLNEEDKKCIMETLTKDEKEEVEDEYYSNIEILRKEFKQYKMELKYRKIDRFNYAVTIESYKGTLQKSN